jgi:dTDP-3-amino-3,4,6-trideoxy-alpha-D-glucose transaminase
MTTPVVLLNDFKRQWEETGVDVMAAVARVGESGWYILGQSVERFEAELATTVSQRFTVGCASGLDAIEIALRALALPAGARVLTTPLSAFATTLAIVRAGGVPVFVDVDARGNLDLALCERLLESRSDIKYAVPVHLYGSPLDLSRLQQLKQGFGLRIVEDCAQAIAASSAGAAVGSVGELAALSFYPTKNLGALGDAGAVATNDGDLAEACRSLRNYGQSTRYVHDRLGLNSRLDELHAAILASAFLPRLAAWTTRRREIAARYLEGLSHPQVQPLLTLDGNAGAVWHLFPVRVAATARQSFRDHLQRAGVQSAVHYPGLIPDQEAMRETPFEVATELTHARAIAAGEVSLPIHPHLDDDDVARVVAAVNGWVAP